MKNLYTFTLNSIHPSKDPHTHTFLLSQLTFEFTPLNASQNSPV